MENRGRCALATTLLWIAAGAAGADCEPWRGEPAPLPTVADPDPLRARWAVLRSAELAQRARLAEVPEPFEAQRLWSRILCLDPGSALAREGRQLMAPVRAHQPRVELAPGRPPGAPEIRGAAWDSLDLPVAFSAPPPPAPRPAPARGRPPPAPAPEASAPAPRRPLEEALRSIQRAEEALRAARFQEALRAAAQARAALGELPGGADLAAPRARLEVAAATAQIGLDDEAAAHESLLRAVEADPGLRLDPERTSPKVLRALELARAARRARR